MADFQLFRNLTRLETPVCHDYNFLTYDEGQRFTVRIRTTHLIHTAIQECGGGGWHTVEAVVVIAGVLRLLLVEGLMKD